MRLVEVNSAEANGDDKDAIDDPDVKPKEASDNIPLLTFDPSSIS